MSFRKSLRKYRFPPTNQSQYNSYVFLLEAKQCCGIIHLAPPCSQCIRPSVKQAQFYRREDSIKETTTKCIFYHRLKSSKVRGYH
jgi:hypothetical protein